MIYSPVFIISIIIGVYFPVCCTNELSLDESAGLFSFILTRVLLAIVGFFTYIL